jgi:hypothetical protein
LGKNTFLGVSAQIKCIKTESFMAPSGCSRQVLAAALRSAAAGFLLPSLTQGQPQPYS